jgi:hypothetical protein
MIKFGIGQAVRRVEDEGKCQRSAVSTATITTAAVLFPPGVQSSFGCRSLTSSCMVVQNVT